MKALLTGFLCASLLILANAVSLAQPIPAAVTVTVKGMVCSFCVQGVEKKLSQINSVKRVKVDLEAKAVQVWVKPKGQLTDKQIHEAIRSAGYNVASIQRAAKAVPVAPKSKPKEAAP